MLSRFKSGISAFITGFLVVGVFVLNVELSADTGGNQSDQYLAFAQEMPEVEGGLAEIFKKIKYPEIAKKAGISGKVYVMAFIDENGNVNDVQVIKGIGGGCDEAAVEAIKQLKFVPGKNEGKPVKVKLSLPITFKLN